MKKNLLNLTLTAVAVVMFSMSIFATPVAPVREMEIPRACSTPGIDGIAEDVYGEVQTTDIFNPTGYDGESDFTAVFQVCWDPSYLYLFAEITDDVLHFYNWGVGNPWEFDNIELFLQLDTNTVTTSYSGTTIQLRFAAGLDSAETQGRAPRTDYGYYMEGSTGSGWLTEVAIPWTAVMAEGSDPEDFMDYVDAVIGFDFSGADSDNSDGDPAVGNRDVQTAWDSDDPDTPEDRTEDLAWNNTSVFGYVTLGYCPILIDNFSSESDLQVVPNPAAESIRLSDVQKLSSLIIYNMQGAVVYSGEYHPGEDLDISVLKSGIYTLTLDGTSGGRFVKK